MRALALASFDVPAAVMDVPEPAAGPGEVLVRISAASVNAYDLGVAGGFMKAYLPYEFPAVIGNDVAGTIEALGEGVTGLSVGIGCSARWAARRRSTTGRSRSSRTRRPLRSRSPRTRCPTRTPDRSVSPERPR